MIARRVLRLVLVVQVLLLQMLHCCCHAHAGAATPHVHLSSLSLSGAAPDPGDDDESDEVELPDGVQALRPAPGPLMILLAPWVSAVPSPSFVTPGADRPAPLPPGPPAPPSGPPLYLRLLSLLI